MCIDKYVIMQICNPSKTQHIYCVVIWNFCPPRLFVSSGLGVCNSLWGRYFYLYPCRPHHPPLPLQCPKYWPTEGRGQQYYGIVKFSRKKKMASARVSTDLTTEENPSTTIVQSVQNQQNSATLTIEDEGRLKINGEK